MGLSCDCHGTSTYFVALSWRVYCFAWCLMTSHGTSWHSWQLIMPLNAIFIEHFMAPHGNSIAVLWQYHDRPMAVQWQSRGIPMAVSMAVVMTMFMKVTMELPDSSRFHERSRNHISVMKIEHTVRTMEARGSARRRMRGHESPLKDHRKPLQVSWWFRGTAMECHKRP